MQFDKKKLQDNENLYVPWATFSETDADLAKLFMSLPSSPKLTVASSLRSYVSTTALFAHVPKNLFSLAEIKHKIYKNIMLLKSFLKPIFGQNVSVRPYMRNLWKFALKTLN